MTYLIALTAELKPLYNKVESKKPQRQDDQTWPLFKISRLWEGTNRYRNQHPSTDWLEAEVQTLHSPLTPSMEDEGQSIRKSTQTTAKIKWPRSDSLTHTGGNVMIGFPVSTQTYITYHSEKKNSGIWAKNDFVEKTKRYDFKNFSKWSYVRILSPDVGYLAAKFKSLFKLPLSTMKTMLKGQNQSINSEQMTQ